MAYTKTSVQVNVLHVITDESNGFKIVPANSMVLTEHQQWSLEEHHYFNGLETKHYTSQMVLTEHHTTYIVFTGTSHQWNSL